jgi:hypothetical protein
MMIKNLNVANLDTGVVDQVSVAVNETTLVMVHLEPPRGEPIPYGELTEEIVMGWVKDHHSIKRAVERAKQKPQQGHPWRSPLNEQHILTSKDKKWKNN